MQGGNKPPANNGSPHSSPRPSITSPNRSKSSDFALSKPYDSDIDAISSANSSWLGDLAAASSSSSPVHSSSPPVQQQQSIQSAPPHQPEQARVEEAVPRPRLPGTSSPTALAQPSIASSTDSSPAASPHFQHTGCSQGQGSPPAGSAPRDQSLYISCSNSPLNGGAISMQQQKQKQPDAVQSESETKQLPSTFKGLRLF